MTWMAEGQSEEVDVAVSCHEVGDKWVGPF